MLKQAAHASVRDGQWLIGMGMAAAVRGAPMSKAGARARPDRTGTVTIETDMTDIGAGSDTIVARGVLPLRRFAGSSSAGGFLRFFRQNSSLVHAPRTGGGNICARRMRHARVTV
ncbi:molybdopterin cofactor-binding domain-containing protein [Xanthomonas sp. BRIP62418]|uniref:molybdopterin cofactor-binding domain-containing protein n=1 Tax=Xanthomonas sp. BRIP62418 TaxID=2182391 RepID=UPI0031B68C72